MDQTQVDSRADELLSTAPMELTRVSVIIPVYNEEENLPLLHEALQESLRDYPYELIYVNDGSQDGSQEILKKQVEEDPEHTRAIEFRRNFGQTTAIAAGIDYATGDVIVLIDADLQNDPADIPMLLDKLEEGYDVVSGWRINRQDHFFRRLPSRIANWMISRVTGVHLHDYGCTLKAYRHEVLEGFRLYGEMGKRIMAWRERSKFCWTCSRSSSC